MRGFDKPKNSSESFGRMRDFDEPQKVKVSERVRGLGEKVRNFGNFGNFGRPFNVKTLVVRGVFVLIGVGAVLHIVNMFVQPRPIYALGVDGCTPHAVLGENGNLNFVCDSNTYTVGETYTDNLGSTTIAAVYEVPENSSKSVKPGWVGTDSGSSSSWNYREDITSANFSSSFINFHPTSTAYWFYHDGYIASITNADNLYTSDVTDMSGM